MSDFESRASSGSLAVVARRGERMCLLAMDVTDPGPDFLGFAIEVRSPGALDASALRNRIAFDYAAQTVTGFRAFPSTEAPFQTFRWIHFPYDPKLGTYSYRVTMMHGAPGALVRGDTAMVEVALEPVTYDGVLDVGFTRNFASSQAFDDKYGAVAKTLIPTPAKVGLAFQKPASDAYAWLGFEALELLNGFLDEVIADPDMGLDMLAYDFNEPDILAKLKQVAARPGALRAIIDDSATHFGSGAAEDTAAAALTALGVPVRRMNFHRLQHNKVLIARKAGQPVKVLCGSTNFSFRGLYIQANNLLVFSEPEVAGLFAKMFELAFADPEALSHDPFTKTWHVVTPTAGPTIKVCFSPHLDGEALSLGPVAGAIDQATCSVLYSVAFLNMDVSGPVRQALDRLIGKPLFSYGVVDKAGGLVVKKPDGSDGLVSFAYLKAKAPEPFKTEWGGGGGITLHHKFIVTDFNQPTAKLFTGSSNLAAGGEKANGDHLIQIGDSKIATAYAIEALRMFDHLHFRANMNALEAAGKAPEVIKLWKPGDAAPIWWTPFYTENSQKQRDRQLFGS